MSNSAKPLLLLTFSIFFPSACTPEKTSAFSFALTDLNQTTTIELPPSFDTLFTWQNSTDYHCGDLRCYRLQPASLGIDKESGFVAHRFHHRWRNLTISYLFHKDCIPSESVDTPFRAAEVMQFMIRSKKVEYPTSQFLFIDSLILDHQKFVAAAWISPDSSSDYQELIYRTKLNGFNVSFLFQSNLPNDSHFISEMQRSFESLQLSKSK